MMLVPVELRASSIDGLGVFTLGPIEAGEIVWCFDERFDLAIPEAELAAAPAHVREFWERYAFEIPGRNGQLALDGDDGRFMNHADDPNLDFSRPGIAVARRPIAAGEELTCHYDELATRPYALEPTRPAAGCAVG